MAALETGGGFEPQPEKKGQKRPDLHPVTPTSAVQHIFDKSDQQYAQETGRIFDRALQAFGPLGMAIVGVAIAHPVVEMIEVVAGAATTLAADHLAPKILNHFSRRNGYSDVNMSNGEKSFYNTTTNLLKGAKDLAGLGFGIGVQTGNIPLAVGSLALGLASYGVIKLEQRMFQRHGKLQGVQY